MIVRLRGELAEVTETAVVLEREGAAYEVLVPAYAQGELGAGINWVRFLERRAVFQCCRAASGGMFKHLGKRPKTRRENGRFSPHHRQRAPRPTGR